MSDVEDRLAKLEKTAQVLWFTVVVLAGLLHWGLPYAYPEYFEAPEFAALRAAVEANPADDALREQFRLEDQRRMQQYFRSRAKLATGAWLLVAGALVLVLSLRHVLALKRAAPARSCTISCSYKGTTSPP